MDQCKIAAYHEAGHALAFWRHGCHVVSVKVNADGTGITHASVPTYFVLPLELDLDQCLAGPVAEAVYLERPTDFEAEEIEHAIWEVASADPMHLRGEEEDLKSAIRACLRRSPDMKLEAITAAIAESATRCETAITYHWDAIETLAEAAYDVTDEYVLNGTVDRVFQTAGVKRPPDFVAR